LDHLERVVAQPNPESYAGKRMGYWELHPLMLRGGEEKQTPVHGIGLLALALRGFPPFNAIQSLMPGSGTLKAGAKKKAKAPARARGNGRQCCIEVYFPAQWGIG
jgi:hypothetical protein